MTFAVCLLATWMTGALFGWAIREVFQPEAPRRYALPALPPPWEYRTESLRPAPGTVEALVTELRESHVKVRPALYDQESL